MANKQFPFNIELLNLTKERVAALKPVKTLDIFDGATSNFHEDGLFSTSVFGRIGEERRDTQFSFIELKTTVFHPLIYRNLCQLKALYKGIMAGTHYAVWSNEEKDFVNADALTGDTGFSFFMSHWRDIDFKETKSVTRKTRVELIVKYKDRALVNRILVIPAGLRDIEVGKDGRYQQDAINELYRRIISASRTIANTDHNENDPTLNQSRKSIQFNFCEIYDLLEKTLAGKRGFIQDKWASRKVFNGTRNVISAIDVSSPIMGAKNSIRVTDTVVGLYQHIKAIEPVTINLLMQGQLSRVFGAVQGRALLVNPKTLKAEYVDVATDVFDRWNSPEGISKVITSFSEVEIRHRPVKIQGHYLALIYVGPDNTFKIISDIDDVPEGRSKKDVRPLSLCELIYLSGYNQWNRYPSLVTRYPITGLGSIYPSTTYVKTTIRSEIRKELGDDWEPMGEDYVAYEFPSQTHPVFVDSLSPHSSRLAGLGGDFDGDTCSYNALYSDEAIEEVKRVLSKRSTYVSPEGGFKSSANIDTIALVLHNMTGRG